MKSCLTAAILLLTAIVGHAQNYQCLQPGVKRYFTNGDGYLRGMRIDSVRTGTGATLYYPFHTARGNYYVAPHMLDSTGGSWLGKKVIALDNGTHIFDNLWNDSVIINTQAHIGDTWHFYDDTSSFYYTAIVTDEDTMSLSGSIDSIKKILIVARNATGIVATDPADSLEIILSKNNGFIKIFDLYTFPYRNPGAAFISFQDYYLNKVMVSSSAPRAKLSFSAIPFTNLTYQQLYQWNVGDVYEYSQCSGGLQHLGFECAPVEQYTMDTVVNVTSIPASTTFDCKGWRSDISLEYAVSPTNNTIIQSASFVVDTALMPEEFNERTIYYYLPGDTSYCITSTLYKLIPGELRGAEYFPPFETWLGYSSYKTPLGLIKSNSAAQDIGNLLFGQTLVYYKHAGQECRQYIKPPTSVDFLDTRSTETQIFPNPASDLLTIKGSGAINSICIVDVVGRILANYSGNLQETTISISDLKSGLYFVKINNITSKRFMKL